VSLIPVADVHPNPRQPRSRFDPQEMEELAASIREHGLIQPIIVTQGDQPGQYLLVAGERRLIAARLASLERVPAILREASDQQRLELALIENVQRTDLGPLEAADAYRQLVEDFDLSHEEIARRVAKSRVTVTNTLRLLKLPAVVQQALAEKRISEGHARALLALPTPEAQEAALHTIIHQDLTVRQTEALVRRLSGERPPARQKPVASPEIAALEERLQSSLGTRVSLNHRKKGGTITIHYYSVEELDAIVDRILHDSDS
jgi:ParB family chromosome partitioning protein